MGQFRIFYFHVPNSLVVFKLFKVKPKVSTHEERQTLSSTLPPDHLLICSLVFGVFNSF